MKITYDNEVDAAYIYLKEISPGGVKKTYSCDSSEVDGTINLDFDETNILVGIEVLNASKKLPQEILEDATQLGNS
ncbi:MAG: DUF2283 domain-containing protein [bacterium]|nr:DUF2283 domain-containing protein [bacterium]